VKAAGVSVRADAADPGADVARFVAFVPTKRSALITRTSALCRALSPRAARLYRAAPPAIARVTSGSFRWRSNARGSSRCSRSRRWGSSEGGLVTFRNLLGPVRAALASALMLVGGALSALAIVGSPQALAHDLRESLNAALAQGDKFYRMAGLDLTLSPDLRATMVQTTLNLMPALMIISAALMVLVNLGVFWRISGRQQRVGYPLFADLVRWSTPEWLIWVLLVTGFGWFIPLQVLRTIAFDLFVCVAAVYFCQ